MRHPDNNTAFSRPHKTEDLRVVFFTDAFRRRNGVGAYYCDLIHHLESQLAECALIGPGETEDGPQQGLSLPMPGDPSQRLCLPGIPKAVKVMRQVRPHVVVSASPGPYGILGSVLAVRFGAAFCYGYHTKYDELASLYWKDSVAPLAKGALSWLDRRFFRRAAMVFTNSAEMKDTAQRMGARQVRIIGTPIDPRLLSPAVPVSAEALESVMFVGRLAAEKNLNMLLDAARAMPDTPFVIAGDGPLAAQVKKAHAELPNLDYIGWIDPETLRRVLDERCEILVLPSKVEAFGTVAAEAMARARLALVSDRCGIIDWPELASGLEVVATGEPLTPRLRELTALPVSRREEKRQSARKKCLAFVDRTVSDWKSSLLAVACP